MLQWYSKIKIPVNHAVRFPVKHGVRFPINHAIFFWMRFIVTEIIRSVMEELSEATFMNLEFLWDKRSNFSHSDGYSLLTGLPDNTLITFCWRGLRTISCRHWTLQMVRASNLSKKSKLSFEFYHSMIWHHINMSKNSCHFTTRPSNIVLFAGCPNCPVHFPVTKTSRHQFVIVFYTSTFVLCGSAGWPNISGVWFRTSAPASYCFHSWLILLKMCRH